MFQESEIVNLLVGFGSVPVLLALGRRTSPPRAGLLYAAFTCILSGYVCTVAEGVFLPDLLNLLEHLAYAAAGCLFLAYVLLLRGRQGPSGDHP